MSGQPWRSLAQPLMRRRAPVFLLHREQRDDAGIRGHTVDELRSAIAALRKSGANFASVRTMVEHGARHGVFPRDAIAITIDDGFADQGRLARVLLEENVPVTVFLVTGFLDGLTWPWDDRVALALLSSPCDVARVRVAGGYWEHTLADQECRRHAVRALQNLLKTIPHDDLEAALASIFGDLNVPVPAAPPPAYEPLSWNEVRQLEKAGVEFGAHSVTHRVFSRLTEAQATYEIMASQHRLRQELCRPLDIFAWPTGRNTDFTPRDCRIAKDAGLRACFAVGDDYATLDPKVGSDALYSLRRFALPRRERHLLQYGSWIERSKQLARSSVSFLDTGAE